MSPYRPYFTTEPTPYPWTGVRLESGGWRVRWWAPLKKTRGSPNLAQLKRYSGARFQDQPFTRNEPHPSAGASFYAASAMPLETTANSQHQAACNRSVQLRLFQCPVKQITTQPSPPAPDSSAASDCASMRSALTRLAGGAVGDGPDIRHLRPHRQHADNFHLVVADRGQQVTVWRSALGKTE